MLDRGLPDGDGLAVLQRMRSAGLGIPCLVLTARDALHDRVEGLDAGADDYLPKPFAMDEMVARVKAPLRRPVEHRTLEPRHRQRAVARALDVASQRAHQHGRLQWFGEGACVRLQG